MATVPVIQGWILSYAEAPNSRAKIQTVRRVRSANNTSDDSFIRLIHVPGGWGIYVGLADEVQSDQSHHLVNVGALAHAMALDASGDDYAIANLCTIAIREYLLTLTYQASYFVSLETIQKIIWDTFESIRGRICWVPVEDADFPTVPGLEGQSYIAIDGTKSGQ